MTRFGPEELRPDPSLARVKLLCCDVDGVMTDGGLYYGESGEAFKRYSVLDGQGLKMLMAAGVEICIVTQGRSGAITSRARALDIAHCHTGVEDKAEVVLGLMAEMGIEADAVAHIADDINDLSLLRLVGVAVTVPNGVPAVRAVSRFVTSSVGGSGAVRELAEAILRSRDLWPAP